MSIFPLPQFEADLAEYERDREAYESLSAPKTIVVRFGAMRLIGEYPYDGAAKPGCGSRLVVRTHRGTELAEMLTSTCPNAGCSKSVTRQEMLRYIENSGGPDYPFVTEGRVLRIATVEDLNEQARIDGLRPAMVRAAQAEADSLMLDMKVVEAEPILGGERLTFYFGSEHRIDFRELVHRLAREFGTRIELRQVGARDEARLVADYEKCGQHCCCRQFLKVLKPISIKAAKTQKATLDPLKISGRCGRLMCCLRYEDQTYTELDKKLPKMKKRIGTPHGIGVVIDRQILTQLVLVQLEGEERKEVAVPAEEVMTPEEYEARRASGELPAPDPLRGLSAEQARRRSSEPRGAAGGQLPGAPRPAGPALPGEPRQRESADRQERFRQRQRDEQRPPRGGERQQRRHERDQDGSGSARGAAPQKHEPSESQPPRTRGPVDLAERARQRKEQQRQSQERRQQGAGESPSAPSHSGRTSADRPGSASNAGAGAGDPAEPPGGPNRSSRAGDMQGWRRRRRGRGRGRGGGAGGPGGSGAGGPSDGPPPGQGSPGGGGGGA